LIRIGIAKRNLSIPYSYRSSYVKECAFVDVVVVLSSSSSSSSSSRSEFFVSRVSGPLSLSLARSLARSIDRSLERWCLELPRRQFSVINIFVATRICGNLTEREEDQFTARFLVAIFGFFWFSWLAVLERQFSLLCLLSASRHQQY
jgi:hypothetical protein